MKRSSLAARVLPLLVLLLALPACDSHSPQESDPGFVVHPSVSSPVGTRTVTAFVNDFRFKLLTQEIRREIARGNVGRNGSSEILGHLSSRRQLQELAQSLSRSYGREFIESNHEAILIEARAALRPGKLAEGAMAEASGDCEEAFWTDTTIVSAEALVMGTACSVLVVGAGICMGAVVVWHNAQLYKIRNAYNACITAGFA